MSRLCWMLAMVLGLAGCGGEPIDGPPRVRFGQAECVHCGMLVSDARYAAAIVAEVEGNRQDLAFDDIGDMIAYDRAREGLHVLRWYVGDYTTGEWLPAEGAAYLRSDAVHTPMGSGLIAFPDPAAAERKRSEVGGEVLTWAELTTPPQP